MSDPYPQQIVRESCVPKLKYIPYGCTWGYDYSPAQPPSSPLSLISRTLSAAAWDEPNRACYCNFQDMQEKTSAQRQRQEEELGYVR